MKKIITGIYFLLLIILSISCTSENQRRTYYISPEGDDNNSGLSENTPWKSLEKVNQFDFQAGDAILFDKAGVWYGNLAPQGNGEPGKPITLSSYGKGSRPVINIGEEEGVGIRLENQSWWEIEGMEITSGAPHKLGIRRGGIIAYAKGSEAAIEHIVIRDCYIHDIWGDVGGDKSGVAIYVGERLLGQDTLYDCPANDILIENNTIRRVDKLGIAVNGDDEVVVRGNYLENLGGDGIIVWGANKGLIEYNIADRTCLRTGDPHLDTGKESRFSWWPHTAAIWIIFCNETIMQYNEVYNTGRQAANGDGMAYDFDFGCKNCVLQYNYSQNNAGFLLIMDNTFGNIARYNVSENDVKFRPTHLVSMFCDTSEQNLIHNNVFYADHGTLDIDYYYGDEYGPNAGKGVRDKGKLGAQFRNNIFYATGQGRFRTVYSRGDSLNSAEFRKLEDFHELPPPVYGAKFLGNCYFGPWMNGLPDDPEKLVADPMFVEAGNGGIGLSSLKGYQLRPGSPCIDAGVFVDMENKRDFFGNQVNDGAIDMGIFECSSQADQ